MKKIRYFCDDCKKEIKNYAKSGACEDMKGKITCKKCRIKYKEQPTYR